MHTGKKVSSYNQFNSKFGSDNCKYKDRTLYLLKKNNFPITRYYLWDIKQSVKENMTKLHDTNLRLPCVVKPTEGTQGIGVMVNLFNIKSISDCISNTIKDGKVPLIEEQVVGKNYRIMVFNNKIIDIVERERPYVIGDNKSTLRSLIRLYNIKQKQNGHFTVKNIGYDIIQKQGYNLDSIIEYNKQIILSDVINYHNGSPIKRVNINSVHPTNINMFIKVNDILNINLSGIDYMSSSLTRPYTEEGYIIEVNRIPDMHIHYKASNTNKNYALKRFITNVF